MPVSLSAVVQPPISADDVRMFLRDYPQNNLLLGQVQFSVEEINKALSYVVDEYNLLPPITSVQVGDIPKRLLLIGACIWLMQ